MNYKLRNTRALLLLLSMFLCASVMSQDRLQNLTELAIKLDTLSKTDIPTLNEKANFSLVNAPLQELFRGIAEAHNLNISMNGNINFAITNNFNDVPVKDLIYFLCKEYDLEIAFTSTIMSVSRAKEAPKPRLPERDIIDRYVERTDEITYDLQGDSIEVFVKQLTRDTRYNVVVHPGIRKTILYGYIKDLPMPSALEKTAFANDLILKKEDESTFAFLPNFTAPKEQQNASPDANTNTRTNRRRSNANQNGRNRDQPGGELVIEKVAQTADLDYYKISARNNKIGELIEQLAAKADFNYVLLTEPEGTFSCFFNKVKIEDLLMHVFQSTKHSFKRENGYYIIGEKAKDGLGITEIYRFKNRSVEEIDKLVPKELTTDVTILLINDMNGVAISGDPGRVNSLKKFMQEIDEAVPNILIEVIVADVRKGSTIRTGISAGIGDSTITTGGSVFPGVDATFSTGGINSFLNNLDKKGVINLGRVTPEFYVTLQALEDNNFLNLRSTPKLSTLNGNEAELTIGNSVYYRVETQNVTGGVNPIVTVTPRFEKVEANLSIKILPFVSLNEDVTLNIDAEFSDFIDPEVEGAPPGNSTRQFISKIRIKNEEMIVLGGLEQKRKAETGSGFPILSKIPILKWIFSSKSKEDSTSKLIVFLKPSIVY